MRVLYQDALEKLSVKRDLYGDFLIELNRRILVIAGTEAAEGGTNLTWSYNGKVESLVWKLLLSGIEGQLGHMYEEGLVNLKTFVEGLPDYTIAIKRWSRPVFHILVYA